MRSYDVAFAFLFLVAFAVQIPLAWLLWAADTSQAGLIRGSVMAGFVLPVVIVVTFWWAYVFFDSMILRVVCWYGVFVIVGKAIVVLLVFTLLIPSEATYSTNLVQVTYPMIPLAIVLFSVRNALRPRVRSVVAGLVGGIALAVVFTYLGFLFMFVFNPSYVPKMSVALPESFLSALASDLIAFAVALLSIFVFEIVKKPRLDIDVPEGEYAEIDAIPNMRQTARIAHLRAVNRPIRGHLAERSTATNCRSRITVKDRSELVIHTEISTKWSARREPYQVAGIYPSGAIAIQIDDYLVGLCNRIDIHANKVGEYFAVAAKIDGDPDCYLFRGESYRSNNQWRLPQDKIPPGDYILEVSVEGDNARSETRKYRLSNQGITPHGLTLEPY